MQAKTEKIRKKGKNIDILRMSVIVVTVFMTAITGYLFLLSIFGTSMITFYSGYETTFYLTDSPLLHISAIIMTFLIGALAAPYIRMFSERMKKNGLIIIHSVMFVLMLFSIFSYAYYPVWDQMDIMNSINGIINSDYSSWKHAGFMYIYPGLNSLVLLLTPPVYLFGFRGGIIAIRILNLVMFFLSSYSVYQFCKEIKVSGIITSILYVCYLPLMLYVFFIYGNITSLSLSTFAVWMAVRYLNDGQKKHIILCAAAMAVSILLKDSAWITMIAILIVLFIYGIADRQLEKILWIPIFIALYLFCNMSFNHLAERITGEEIPSGMSPYGHLTMGISEGSRANGWYNGFTRETLEACGYDYEIYADAAKNAFLQRSETFWSDSSYVCDFFVRKTASQWNNPTFESTWILQDMLYQTAMNRIDCNPAALFIDGSSTNMIYYYIFNLLQSIILFGSLCFFIFESRNSSLASLIPAIIFIGGFIFLFFYEAKAQYTLLFFVMLFPYAPTGFLSLFRNIKKLTIDGNKKYFYRSKTAVFLGVLLFLILFISAMDPKNAGSAFKLGVDDEYYNECLEQHNEFYNKISHEIGR